MAEKWYEDLSDDDLKTDVDKMYEQAFSEIRHGLADGLDFDSACAAVDVLDDVLKQVIINDMLKVLIAEEHFARKISLDDLASKLKISVIRLETAKQEMFEDLGHASRENFYKSFGSGNA